MTVSADASARPSEARTVPRWLSPAAVVVATVVVWWLVTTVVGAGNRLLREFAPQHCLPALIALARQGALLDDIATSLWRLLVGMLIALLIAIPVGLVTGMAAELERASRPVFQFLRMISPLSWAPVAVGLFGIGHPPVFFLVAAAAIWPVVLNTAQGVREVNPGHVLVARSLGATSTEVLRTIILPTVRGSILTGIRLALGIAWVVLVPAEMLGVDSGLGYEILNMRDQLAYDRMMALIIVIGVLGYVLDSAARIALAPTRGAFRGHSAGPVI